MKHIRTVLRNVEEHDTPTCDICGEKVDWENHGDPYKLEEAIVSYKSGDSVDGSSHYNHFAPDICSKCMREKVIPTISKMLNRDAWEEVYEGY